ncbi:unnamed protein product [Menidia menidia]|uniref:(Atlantic silverside) hypothetical protein n=1 Tax=Menidia menidia TaxID=238744 RepID=A0A8S4AVF5_9TELE|nr:unnamed protein product [Menidia menidia]
MDTALLVLLCAFPVVWCYSSGLIMDSCGDLLPHHSGLRPQTGPSPYTVTTEHSSYRPGEEVKVMLQGPASSPFIGFLLQARVVGDSFPVGWFSLISTAAQLLTCHHRSNASVSHRSNSAKNSIQVAWKSEPSGDIKAVTFHASFVQNYQVFWVNVTSPSLKIVNDYQDGSTSSPTPPVSSTPQLHGISSAGCGITKVCFSQPPNCDPTVFPDCYFMSAMMTSPNGPAIRYEMTGPSDGYIAFGFSDDQMMGNDDIYICGVGNNGRLWVQRAFSTGRSAPQVVPLGNVSEVKTSMQNRVLSCSFTSTNMISTKATSGFKKSYHLMFAHGPSNRGGIQIHTGTFISANKIDVSRPSLAPKAGLPCLIQAHGALMLIAWMTLGSVGMMVARYLRAAAGGLNFWGKDVWFLVHAAVMSVTLAATAIAFILSFSHVKAWSGGAHPVLGCIVMILSSLQLFLALLRCGPQHKLRFLFSWFHALNGMAIKSIAVAAIFTGLELIDSTTDHWLMKVMGGFVGWEVLFYILLEYNLKWKVKGNDNTASIGSKMMRADTMLVTLYFLGNFSFLIALLVGIGML